MYLRTEDRDPRLSSGLPLRVAILGGIVIVAFVVIFFRLWYLQVLSGDKYLAQANDNRTRTTRIIAPRGEILDRDGRVLVGNRTALALQVNPGRLPGDEAERQEQLTRVGELVDMSLERVRKTIQRGLEDAPGAPVTLRRDVSSEVVFYIEENRADFPGVDVNQVFVRRYPRGTLAAHLMGYVREVNAEQLSEPRFRGVDAGDEVGQDGLEYTYDRYLRGTPGLDKFQVDSVGRLLNQLETEEPKPGSTLSLTLDADVQAAGEAALQSVGLPGAFVTMNVEDGSILGMGSAPTFDPSVYARPVLSEKLFNTLFSENTGAPALNRAVAGLYPTGSTYKVITSLAALENDLVETDEIIVDTGEFNVGGVERQNAGGKVYGPIAMRYALQVSSDVYYYILGDRLFQNDPSTELQRWSRMLGIGRDTGIDLPGELEGLLPTPEWRNELYEEGGTDRPWSEGDNVSLAVGQGDLQANPLQLAVAYAAIANGGTIVTPHLAEQVTDSSGRLVQEFDPGPQRKIEIDPEYQKVIMAGLHDAAQTPGGTSYGVFGGFPIPVAGKTGTAERYGYEDQSWYAVTAPYPDPDVVTIVTFEEGGFGADTAAPVALAILSEYFGKQASAVQPTGNVE